MLKKIIIGSMSLIFIGSWSFLTYRLLEPKESTPLKEIFVNATAETNLNNENITSYMQVQQGNEFYYFCTTESPDCDYVNEHVLKPLAKEVNLASFDMIKYVDMTTFDVDTSQQKMRNLYGFQSFPAFIAVKSNEGTIEIISTLQWDKNNPFDTEQLKKWMIENNIWPGEIKADEATSYTNPQE